MGALAGLRFHPNLSAVTFDRLTADGQPDPGPLIFITPMQALERSKNLLVVLEFDANSIIAHTKSPLLIRSFTGQMDLRPPAGLGELESVADQVLIQLREQGCIAQYVRQRLARDLGPRSFDLHLHGLKRSFYTVVQGDAFARHR